MYSQNTPDNSKVDSHGTSYPQTRLTRFAVEPILPVLGNSYHCSNDTLISLHLIRSQMQCTGMLLSGISKYIRLLHNHVATTTACTTCHAHRGANSSDTGYFLRTFELMHLHRTVRSVDRTNYLQEKACLDIRCLNYLLEACWLGGKGETSR